MLNLNPGQFALRSFGQPVVRRQTCGRNIELSTALVDRKPCERKQRALVPSALARLHHKTRVNELLYSDSQIAVALDPTSSSDCPRYRQVTVITSVVLAGKEEESFTGSPTQRTKTWMP